MRPYNLFAFHGFMGKQEEWKLAGLPIHQRSSLYPYGFNELCSITPAHGLTFWGDHFIDTNLTSASPDCSILLGYSLGGRLGMHSLLQQPLLWKAAIIVSAHPGLSDPEEKKSRMNSDEVWAERFELDDWEVVMRDWNAQVVFNSSPHTFTRNPEAYSRVELAAALRHWSLGKQEDLTRKLEGSSVPILWITGENDIRYVNISKKLHFDHPKSCKWIAPNSAHRVPWEQPKAFSEKVGIFLDSL